MEPTTLVVQPKYLDSAAKLLGWKVEVCEGLPENTWALVSKEALQRLNADQLHSIKISAIEAFKKHCDETAKAKELGK